MELEMQLLRSCPCKNCTVDWDSFLVGESCHEVCYWFKHWINLINKEGAERLNLYNEIYRSFPRRGRGLINQLLGRIP